MCDLLLFEFKGRIFDLSDLFNCKVEIVLSCDSCLGYIHVLLGLYPREDVIGQVGLLDDR